MFQKKTGAALSTLAAATAFLISSYTPAAAQGMPQGWFKVCSKQQDVNICNTLNNVMSETGQLLTVVNLIEFSGGQAQKRIRVTVPTNRYLPDGVQVQVGDGPVKKIPYIFCVGPTCVADDELDNATIDAMKKGQKLTVTSVNFRGDINPIDVSLNGFTVSYTGPGMQQKDFEAEQRKMQEAVQAKQKEIEDRMRAEQEKAKAGK